MTINLSSERKPLGTLTWVAILRDGAIIAEFDDDQPQKSFDCLAGLDVAEVQLIPIDGATRGVHVLRAAPGEEIKKKWIRTFTMMMDSPDETQSQIEHPVIDAYILISDKPVWHYTFHDGATLITTSEEP
jgi:hypothetical protein